MVHGSLTWTHSDETRLDDRDSDDLDDDLTEQGGLDTFSGEALIKS